MSYIYESDGKSRADAEARALEFLGVDAEQVIFKPLSAGAGLFSFMSRKPSMVRVYPADDNFPSHALIKGMVVTLIRKMGMEAEVDSIEEMNGNLVVSLNSEDSGILIGKQGRTLDAIQFVLNLIIDPSEREGKRLMIDVAHYRERRHKKLARLAKSVADRVAKSRRSVLLDYMNPYERRIIHLALEEDARVFTRSDGNGVYKRVRILPAEAKDLPDDEIPVDDDTPQPEGYDDYS